MTPKYFLAACALAIAILVPLGAPVPALAGGIALATLLNVSINKVNSTTSRGLKRAKKPTS